MPKLKYQETYDIGQQITPRCIVCIYDTTHDLFDLLAPMKYPEKYVEVTMKNIKAQAKLLIFDSYRQLESPIYAYNKDNASYLKRVTTEKDMNNAAGRFDISFTGEIFTRSNTIGSVSLAYWLKPMDYIEIYFNSDKQPTMIGFIDRVENRGSINPSTGQPDHEIVVTGRDFGKFLVNSKLIAHEAIFGAEWVAEIARTYIQTAKSSFSNCSSKYLEAISIVTACYAHLISAEIIHLFKGIIPNISMEASSDRGSEGHYEPEEANKLRKSVQEFLKFMRKKFGRFAPHVFMQDIESKGKIIIEPIDDLFGVIATPPIVWNNPEILFNSVNYEGNTNLWTFLKNIASEPFMEVFVDTTGRLLDLPCFPRLRGQDKQESNKLQKEQKEINNIFDFWSMVPRYNEDEKATASTEATTEKNYPESTIITRAPQSSNIVQKPENTEEMRNIASTEFAGLRKGLNDGKHQNISVAINENGKVKGIYDKIETLNKKDLINYNTNIEDLYDFYNPDWHILPAKDKLRIMQSRATRGNPKKAYTIKLNSLNKANMPGYPGKKAYLVIRPRMWNSYAFKTEGKDPDQDWNIFDDMLPIAIDTQRIRNYSLTCSDEEVYSFYLTIPKFSVQTNYSLIAFGHFLFDLHHLIKFGYKPLEVPINNLSYETNTSPLMEELLRRSNRNLGHWFNNNHLRWSGMLVLENSPHIRIGQKIFFCLPEHGEVEIIDQDKAGRYKQYAMYAYTTRVKNTWTYPKDLITEVYFTRGAGDVPTTAWKLPPPPIRHFRKIIIPPPLEETEIELDDFPPLDDSPPLPTRSERPPKEEPKEEPKESEPAPAPKGKQITLVSSVDDIEIGYFNTDLYDIEMSDAHLNWIDDPLTCYYPQPDNRSCAPTACFMALKLIGKALILGEKSMIKNGGEFWKNVNSIQGFKGQFPEGSTSSRKATVYLQVKALKSVGDTIKDSDNFLNCNEKKYYLIDNCLEKGYVCIVNNKFTNAGHVIVIAGSMKVTWTTKKNNESNSDTYYLVLDPYGLYFPPKEAKTEGLYVTNWIPKGWDYEDYANVGLKLYARNKISTVDGWGANRLYSFSSNSESQLFRLSGIRTSWKITNGYPLGMYWVSKKKLWEQPLRNCYGIK